MTRAGAPVATATVAAQSVNGDCWTHTASNDLVQARTGILAVSGRTFKADWRGVVSLPEEVVTEVKPVT